MNISKFTVYVILIFFTFWFTLKINALNSNEKKQNEKFCKNFQSGLFLNVCSTGHSSKFKRLNGIQIQEYDSYYLKEKNNWTEPCAYTNTLIETNDPKNRDYIGNQIFIRMVNVTKVSYRTLEADVNDNNAYCEVKKIGEIDPNTIL
ncbi:hypothetical protein P3G55_05415 [Leptospira sp. 96542]|nr:hypothetical protein [Leptospira sp. 96542]